MITTKLELGMKLEEFEVDFYNLVDRLDVSMDSKVELKGLWVGLKRRTKHKWDYEHPTEED